MRSRQRRALHPSTSPVLLAEASGVHLDLLFERVDAGGIEGCRRGACPRVQLLPKQTECSLTRRSAVPIIHRRRRLRVERSEHGGGRPCHNCSDKQEARWIVFIGLLAQPFREAITASSGCAAFTAFKTGNR